MGVQPFPKMLADLLEERDWSLRDLARKCQNDFNGWGSIATLSRYQRGQLTPTATALERLAYSLRVQPDIFPEYRLYQARAKLDPEKVGLSQAIVNLERFNPET